MASGIDDNEGLVDEAKPQMAFNRATPLATMIANHGFEESQRQSEQNSSDQHNMLATLFDCVPSVLILLNRDIRVERINRAGEELCGARAAELLHALAGKALRCVNAFEGSGCGRNAPCAVCPVRTRVTNCFQTGASFRQEEGSLSISQGERTVPLDFLISTARITVKDAVQVLLTLTEITERKRMEQALAQQAEIHRALLNTTPDGVIESDEHDRITDVNQTYCRLLGYSRTELTALSIPDIEANKKPEEVKQQTRWIKREGNAHFGARHRAKDGRLIDVDISIAYVPSRNRYLAFCRDITARKLAEEALRESEEKFAKAFRDSPAGMAIRDAETGRYVDANNQCLAMTGYSREEVVGRSPVELGWWTEEADRDGNRPLAKAMENVHERELQLRHKDGHMVIISNSTHEVRIGGRPFLLSFSLDITARRKAEMELEALTHTLGQKNRELENLVQAMRCKSDG
jgi:PAS domain S-box-containing protein